MDFKQDTIGDILASEREMILHGAECYGDFFINASGFNHLLNIFVKSVDDPNKFIFFAFLFQIRKYYTLAWFSATRRHHVQTSMNLRYLIEAGQWAAYAMGNIEQEKFCSIDSNGIIHVKYHHKNSMYKWLDENFKPKADEFKRLKKLISGAGAHSDITFAFNNFKMENPGFRATFFDPENDFLIKTDLWFVANTALGLLDLFYGVNLKYKVFKLIDGFDLKFKNLVKVNYRLKEEMMKTENYKKAESLINK